MLSTRIFLVAAAAMVGYQLMLPPVVGLGNNGDFSRTYGIFHVTMPIDLEARYAVTKFQFDPRVNYFGGFYSSEILLVPAALALNALLSKDGNFDVRCIGFLHGALFWSALACFLPLLDDSPPVLRWLMGALVLAMFGDVMYVAYLNSFYTDVSAYLFLLLAVVFGLRFLRWRRPADAILLAVASLFLATSKAQHAPLGLWLAAWFAILGWRGKNVRWFSAWAAALSAIAVFWLAKSTPEPYAARGCFSTVFHHLLPHARDTGRTLADLGLDESYRPYIGMVSFSGGSPMDDPRFVAEFRRRVTYGSLAWFLLTHPRDGYVALRASLDEAGRQRPALGNFDPSAGLPPYTESQAFAFWSAWKRALFDRRGSRYVTCFLVIGAAVVGLLMGQRRSLPAGSAAAGLVLIGMAATELAVASLADAMDIPRHHLLFYTFFDLLLLAGVCLAGRWLGVVRESAG